jgi:diphthine methyl ester synthase
MFILEQVESDCEQIYLSAATEDIGFLVVGDPLCATTHTDLILRFSFAQFFR